MLRTYLIFTFMLVHLFSKMHLIVVSAILILASADQCDVFQEAACPLYQQNIVGYIVTSDTGQCQER